MRKVLLRATVIVAVVLGPSGCSGSSPAEDDVLSPRALDCHNPIDVLDELPDGWREVAGVIALPGDGILQRGRHHAELGRTFSKFGLLVRADRVFTIAVAAESRPNALLGWGTSNTDPPVSAIEVPGCPGVCELKDQPGCPEGTTGDWVVYPGGVWTVDPACIAVTIQVEGAVEVASLPVGVPCD